MDSRELVQRSGAPDEEREEGCTEEQEGVVGDARDPLAARGDPHQGCDGSNREHGGEQGLLGAAATGAEEGRQRSAERHPLPPLLRSELLHLRLHPMHGPTGQRRAVDRKHRHQEREAEAPVGCGRRLHREDNLPHLVEAPAHVDEELDCPRLPHGAIGRVAWREPNQGEAKEEKGNVAGPTEYNRHLVKQNRDQRIGRKLDHERGDSDK
mmetsp:Transcript_61361/g.154941  ORF Transcript_61361/g.154941 Transcript_61361/m.154941 type:complete len:210 (-) Transcript_61361:265-894(-)